MMIFTKAHTKQSDWLQVMQNALIFSPAWVAQATGVKANKLAAVDISIKPCSAGTLFQ